MTQRLLHRLSSCFSSGLLGMLLLAAPTVFAEGLACPMPATPSGARVEMVAPDMRTNGVASTVRAVQSALSVEGLLAFYRDLWAPLATASRPGSREDAIEGWRVISTVNGNCFTTVQVRAQGLGSYALVAVAQQPNPTTQRSASVADFPALYGSRVLRDTDFKDDVRNARTVVLINRQSLIANVNFYLTTLKGQGWTATMQRQPESSRGTSYVLVLRRGLEEMNIVISPAKEGGAVMVVVNVTDKP